jgi:hypothetical protein
VLNAFSVLNYLFFQPQVKTCGYSNATLSELVKYFHCNVLQSVEFNIKTRFILEVKWNNFYFVISFLQNVSY